MIPRVEEVGAREAAVGGVASVGRCTCHESRQAADSEGSWANLQATGSEDGGPLGVHHGLDPDHGHVRRCPQAWAVHVSASGLDPTCLCCSLNLFEQLFGATLRRAAEALSHWCPGPLFPESLECGRHPLACASRWSLQGPGPYVPGSAARRYLHCCLASGMAVAGKQTPGVEVPPEIGGEMMKPYHEALPVQQSEMASEATSVERQEVVSAG